MAWRDREWILNGAAVHVCMVGFDDGTLDGALVATINANLTSAWTRRCSPPTPGQRG